MRPSSSEPLPFHGSHTSQLIRVTSGNSFKSFCKSLVGILKKSNRRKRRCAQLIEAKSNYLQSKFYGCMHRFTAIFRISTDWWFIVSCAAGTNNKDTHVRPTVLTPNRRKHLPEAQVTFTVRNQHHVLHKVSSVMEHI